MKSRRIAGYFWATAGVVVATVIFWLLRSYFDKGQASLLYLPVVIACAIRFGFGPAVWGALLSFLCWDFFFLPPHYTFIITDPKDWLSLFVFMLAAITTAQLAAQAQTQTLEARAREAGIATLFAASEAITREVRADNLLDVLVQQLRALCQTTRCLVFRRTGSGEIVQIASSQSAPGALSADELKIIAQIAEAAAEHNQIIGFGDSAALWTKALRSVQPPVSNPAVLGAYVPLQSEGKLVGVLHIGPRLDGRLFSAADERLILTLANHAAVVIAREELAQQAAQAVALREADTLKDSLLSMVSHELRTPLAAIKASASGLLQPGSDWQEKERHEALAAINSEADRLTFLVGNLLDLSRLEAGAWQPTKDWCDLTEIVGTALDRFSPEQAARVQVSVEADVPLIRADYTQIALVLTNLLENALKYTPESSPILLGIASEESDVMIQVRDFGTGLIPGEEAAIFERFYRGENHKNSAVHGTGLGLALCRAIVQGHGGRMDASNAPFGEPSGALFSVHLPTK